MEDTKTSLFASRNLPGGQAVIATIQSKIRDSNAVDKILQRATAVLDHGTIPLKGLLDILEEYEVYLDSRECELIDRRFLNPNGNIEYHRLMKTLDFGLPQDHMDPDHFADPLPQPYRMISKVLELEIIDNAWNEILRRYPEVHEEIPGKDTIIRRNRNLDVECFASSQSDRSKLIASMVSGGQYVYTVNTAGAFVVIDNTTGKFLQTLQVFQEEVEPSFLRIHMTNASSVSLLSGCCRVAVLKIQPVPLEAEVVDPEAEKKAKAAAAKAKPKGKNAPPPEPEPVKKLPPGFKCGVSLIEVSTGNGRAVECKFVHSFDCLLFDSDVYTDLSDDGRALLICHGIEVSLFKFPAMDSKGIAFAKKMAEIHEDDMSELHEDGPEKVQVQEPITPPLCQWNMRDEILKHVDVGREHEKMTKILDDNCKVLSCHVFPFQKELSWDDGVPESISSESSITAASGAMPAPQNSAASDHKDKHERQFQNGLAVFLQEKNVWFVFGILSGTHPPLQDPAIAIPTSASATSLPLGATGAPPVLELIRHWTLSSSVSALDFDDKRTVVAIGQSDGTVSLWDLRSMQLLSAPGRHNSTVTAISFTTGVDSHLMVSGDKEGVMCFYKLYSATSSRAATTSGRSDSQIPAPSSRPCLKAELVDFRMDFRDEVLRIWRISGVSIVVVQIASGRLVVYDADGSELLGRLCLTSGIPGQKLEYAFFTMGDCIVDTTVEAAEDSKIPEVPAGDEVHPSPVRIPKSTLQMHRERLGVGATCCNGFCGYFSRVGMKTVVASFSVNKMLSFLFPGINALSHKKRTRDVDLSVLYGLLTPSERMNEKIRVSDVAALGDAGRDSVSGTDSKVSLVKSGSRASVSRTPSRQVLSRTQSGAGGITLTAEHLMELEKKYLPLSAPLPPLSLSDCSLGRMALPRSQFEKSVKCSQIERAKRKSSILSGMQQMAELF